MGNEAKNVLASSSTTNSSGPIGHSWAMTIVAALAFGFSCTAAFAKPQATGEWAPPPRPSKPDLAVLPIATAQSNLLAPPSCGSHSDCLQLPPVTPTLSTRSTAQRPPGYMPGLLRYGVTAPVAPSVVSVHSGQRMFLPPEKKGGPMTLAHEPPRVDCHSCPAPYCSSDFSADPFYDCYGWDPCVEMSPYDGKYCNPNQRPLLEWGLPLYQNGLIPPSYTFLGETNLVMPKLYVFGDFRTAFAQNRNAGNTQSVWANRLNLDIDLAITATERFHMFLGPLDERQEFTGFEFDGGNARFQDSFDGFDERTDTMFFEGDLGYIVGGLRGVDAPFDLPFAVGLIPLLYQNGIWMEDAFVGAAVTIPARNSPLLDWSNFDTTLFVGFDEITSQAFGSDNEAANVFGATTFIEARGGYIEIGYAFLDDTTNSSRNYHNIGISYTRRYLNLVSNSARLIVNTGQEGPGNQRTADGYLVLLENSFLTSNPYNVIPYANFFAGYRTPQPVARLQGPLKNTGINFESDLLTGYPILDDTANNTWGGAIGLDLLGNCFEQQLIVEFAMLQAFGSPVGRNAPGDQYAMGIRYQRPLNNAIILRCDAMYGWLENAQDISGIRTELRHKF